MHTAYNCLVHYYYRIGGRLQLMAWHGVAQNIHIIPFSSRPMINNIMDTQMQFIFHLLILRNRLWDANDSDDGYIEIVLTFIWLTYPHHFRTAFILIFIYKNIFIWNMRATQMVGIFPSHLTTINMII